MFSIVKKEIEWAGKKLSILFDQKGWLNTLWNVLGKLFPINVKIIKFASFNSVYLILLIIDCFAILHNQ